MAKKHNLQSFILKGFLLLSMSSSLVCENTLHVCP